MAWHCPTCNDYHDTAVCPVGFATAFPGTNLIDYPFPLRDGLIAHLVLPDDLTDDEVARLHKFLLTIVC